jgi:hypothetical protein
MWATLSGLNALLAAGANVNSQDEVIMIICIVETHVQIEFQYYCLCIQSRMDSQP